MAALCVLVCSLGYQFPAFFWYMTVAVGFMKFFMSLSAASIDKVSLELSHRLTLSHLTVTSECPGS